MPVAFITGGTGFVGGHLCERLRREGWTVRALARKNSKCDVLESVGCQIIRGDLETERALQQHAGDADVIFHLAAITKAARERDFYRINSEGTKNVLIAAQESGFRGRFVLLSSLAAAGPSRDGRPIHEKSDPRPVSHYGKSKRLAERMAIQARDAFDVTILRPGGIYGPREHEIYQVLKPLRRTGLAVSWGPDIRVQLTHVADVVEGLFVAATHPETANKTYFVNDQQAWKYSEVMRLLGEVLGRRVYNLRLPAAAGWALAGVIDTASRAVGRPLFPFNRDKMRELAGGSWIADSSRLTRDSGWRAKWPLSDGLRHTISWYRENGWL